MASATITWSGLFAKIILVWPVFDLIFFVLRHFMVTKLAVAFLVKSTKAMRYEHMPHDGAEPFSGSDNAQSGFKLYRRHPLLAETRQAIRRMTPIDGSTSMRLA